MLAEVQPFLKCYYYSLISLEVDMEHFVNP